MSTINDLISVLGDGRANSQHAKEIEDRLKMESGNTQEPTRMLIRDAIVNHEMPIGSTPQDGYFIINNEEELKETVNNLKQRIKGLRKRIDGLSRGWQQRQQSRRSGGNWPK